MEQIFKYFPNLTDTQKNQFGQLPNLYADWNLKINVISRKDIEHIVTHHILHSLAIAKFTNFAKGTTVLDIGTGGGFPGIPLAIMFPDTKFHLIDSIGKKITVVNNIIESLGLKNAKGEQIRVENLKSNYNYIVSRAVTSFPSFVNFAQKNLSVNQSSGINNGIIYLKGGDFAEETKEFKNIKIVNISEYFEEEFFETKKIIYLPKQKK